MEKGGGSKRNYHRRQKERKHPENGAALSLRNQRRKKDSSMNSMGCIQIQALSHGGTGAKVYSDENILETRTDERLGHSLKQDWSFFKGGLADFQRRLLPTQVQKMIPGFPNCMSHDAHQDTQDPRFTAVNRVGAAGWEKRPLLGVIANSKLWRRRARGRACE